MTLFDKANISLCTWANDTGIVPAVTLLSIPPPVRTLPQVVLIPSALHIIHDNISRAVSKGDISWRWHSMSTSLLVTDNVCIIYIPGILTNGPPGSSVKYFNTPFTLVPSIHQPHWHFFERKKRISLNLGYYYYYYFAKKELRWNTAG